MKSIDSPCWPLLKGFGWSGEYFHPTNGDKTIVLSIFYFFYDSLIKENSLWYNAYMATKSYLYTAFLRPLKCKFYPIIWITFIKSIGSSNYKWKSLLRTVAKW